jgi:hypothetical protein
MKLSDLFEVQYGHSLSLNKLRQVSADEGIAFVSRTARNNGVAAWVERVTGVEPLPAGLLTVCLRSRNYALATFLQPRPFYTGYHIYVLRPHCEMSDQEKLWWAQTIEANRFRYNFGRQANRSLAALELPDTPPAWATSVAIPKFTSTAKSGTTISLQPERWVWFGINELFDVIRGRHVLKRDMKPGKTAYVSASAVNNGVTAWIDLEADFPGGQITISSNGSVAETFFQSFPFIASGDVTVLQPKTPISDAAALFVCTVIYADKYRWNYGRKWTTGRIKETSIPLPATASGLLDWELMTRYILNVPVASIVPWTTAPNSASYTSHNNRVPSDRLEQTTLWSAGQGDY